jgi:hypothetical protein
VRTSAVQAQASRFRIHTTPIILIHILYSLLPSFHRSRVYVLNEQKYDDESHQTNTNHNYTNYTNHKDYCKEVIGGTQQDDKSSLPLSSLPTPVSTFVFVLAWQKNLL